jgi:hypothetical protein
MPRRRDSHNPGHMSDLSEQPPRLWSPTLRGAKDKTIRLNFAPGMRLVVRRAVLRNKLQAFAIVLQVREDGEWAEVARGDCSHGQPVHLDFLDRVGEIRRKQPVCEITCQADVLTGYKEVYATLQENAENYVREWRRHD